MTTNVEYHQNPKINAIMVNAKDADLAFGDLREYAEKYEGTGAFAYFLGPSLLGKRFDEPQVMDAIHSLAQFDQDDEDKRLATRAKRFIEKFNKWRSEDKFIADLLEYGLAAYRAGGVLHVAHKCQKTDAKPYQVSRFVVGQGVCGDTTYWKPEQIFEHGVCGAGIPNSAVYIPYDQIFDLEDEFKVDSYSTSDREKINVF
ncbi:hypothetical protein LCS82_08530 [Vibrio harveyi]|uniref:Uncharacterized protein n=1 Tax=Vibrio jasicida TaxID=766224 RepID=A0AAU9QUW6_9VIBR|nr:hypothetical protein [Vibrio coralliilyticus]PAW02405.1 hypothetical protein CKJ79_17225 [Vibrio coralliilyticus]CAH1588772.1 conserved hypothetical protein [Vibrio jasicida]CAH1599764.1 conserved hypothetical protein [Vibrio jasicida]